MIVDDLRAGAAVHVYDGGVGARAELFGIGAVDRAVQGFAVPAPDGDEFGRGEGEGSQAGVVGRVYGVEGRAVAEGPERDGGRSPGV